MTPLLNTVIFPQVEVVVKEVVDKVDLRSKLTKDELVEQLNLCRDNINRALFRKVEKECLNFDNENETEIESQFDT